MCGISGVILRPGERADGSLTAAMARDMAHRGPDAQTGFTHENFSFTHRRLKVIDVSDAANQPLFNEAGDVGVVFNGEIYNFVSLRESLLKLGHRFATRSDTEVIVHSFEEWGEDCFRRFNGMFAIAIWDGRGDGNRFYLARDKKGVKPLYYSIAGGRLGFASETKAILRLPWVAREVDHAALFHYLKFSHVPNPATALAAVRQLEPAHFLRFGPEGPEKKCYWDSASIRAEPTENASLEDWQNRFETTLDAVVQRQTVSDVPVGCFLSGGIDSSLLALAFSRRQRGLKTFSIGYREKAQDETSHARRVAEILGTDHHELIAEPRDFRELVPEIPKFFDQPFADPTMLSTMLLSRLAREKVTVALSGDGADELFWGYPYQQALSRLRPLLYTPPRARSLVCEALSARAAPFSDRARKLLEILQFRGETELFQYFIGMIGPLRADRVAALVRGDVSPYAPALETHLGRAEGMRWETKIEYVFQNSFLVDTVLAKTDRATMAYGLEARVPFLDDDMLELSARMPFSMKRRFRQSKFLLRSVLGKYLPPSVSSRAKQGFSVPMQAWLRGELRYLLHDHIFSDGAGLNEWLDMPRIQALAREHIEEKRNHQHLLWSVICLSLWKERYVRA